MKMMIYLDTIFLWL